MCKIHVKFELAREPARIYTELHARGIVHSTRDALCKGVYKLIDEALERDLKKARLDALNPGEKR